MPVKDISVELNALVSMMDEPNEQMFETIKQNIANYGRIAIPVLEDAWMNSFSEEQNDRLEELIGDIRFQELNKELLIWKNSVRRDLLDAFLLLARLRYPELHEKKYREQLDNLKKDAWLEMNDELTALEKTKVLNHIFYDEYGFRGIPLQQTISLNSYFLNEVLDTKVGNSLSLGIMYMAVAQSLSIPVFGVDLPQHFVLAYLDDAIPLQTLEKYSKEDVLFYINAMNKGAVFTSNEIELFIKQMNRNSKEKFFMPCDNLTIVRRLFTELINSFQSEGDMEKVGELQKLMQALD